jgi:hypothetical protein
MEDTGSYFFLNDHSDATNPTRRNTAMKRKLALVRNWLAQYFECFAPAKQPEDADYTFLKAEGKNKTVEIKISSGIPLRNAEHLLSFDTHCKKGHKLDITVISASINGTGSTTRMPHFHCAICDGPVPQFVGMTILVDDGIALLN